MNKKAFKKYSSDKLRVKNKRCEITARNWKNETGGSKREGKREEVESEKEVLL